MREVVTEPRQFAFKNKLVRNRWLGIALSATSVVLFSLYAAKAVLLLLPIWIPVALVLVGIGFASILPLLSPRRTIPDYLVLDKDGLWAVYGKPGSPNRIGLNHVDITRFEGGGPNDVILYFVAPGLPRSRLRFQLSGDSHPTLDQLRGGIRSGSALSSNLA